MFVTPRTILANHTLLEPNSEVIAWAKMFLGSGWKQRGPLSLWDQPGGASCPWGRRCSKPWASSSAGYLGPCLCACTWFLRPSWFFLFSSKFMGLNSFLLHWNRNIERGLKISIFVKLFSGHFRSHCCSSSCLQFQSA